MIGNPTIFGVAVPVFWLCLDAAFFVGGWMTWRRWPARDVRRRHLLILCAGAYGVSLIGSRALSLLEFGGIGAFHASAFAEASGGYTFYGGLAAGMMLVTVYAVAARLPLARTFDAMAPGLVAGYAIGRLGCFLVGDGCYGVATALPWGMRFPNGVVPAFGPVHPTPLYEIACAVAVLLLVRRLSPALRHTPGGEAAVTMFLLALARFGVEYVRRNPRYAGLSMAQWTAAAVMIVTATMLMRLRTSTAVGERIAVEGERWDAA